MADKKIQVGDTKFEQQCKTCNCEFRDRIEAKRLVDGMTLLDMVAWCKEELGYSITYKGLQNHFSKHIDHIREVRVAYYDEQFKIDSGELPDPTDKVQMDLWRLKNLDASIAQNVILNGGAAVEIRTQLKEKVPKFYTMYDSDGNVLGKKRLDRAEVNAAVASLFKSTSEEIRNATEAKYRILGMDSRIAEGEAQGSLVDTIVNLTDKLIGNVEGKEKEELKVIQFDDDEYDVVDGKTEKVEG
jgi:hypothetical protein